MSVPANGIVLPVDALDAARQRRNRIGFYAMCLGVFMAFLDIQIVASSINQIQAGLLATPQEMAWVQSAYLIAEVIAIPLSGILSRILSTRVYFTVSALGFTAASLLCALAWNIESMMVFRAIQGFLGGGMIPASFAALFIMFPPERRVGPQVLAGLMATSAPTLGPVIGGYITELLSWHWLFLINLGPGLLVAATVWLLVDIDRPEPALWRRIDVPGVIAMALFLGALEWVLEEGPAHHWLDDSTIAFWAVVAGAAGAAFFWRVFTHEHPIIDLRAFRDRQFACANLATILLTISLFATNYVVPLFLGQVRDFNSIDIGNTLMVSGAAMFMAAPFGARLARQLDLRVLFSIGSLMVALGSWMMTDLTQTTGFHELMVPQMLRGAGFMLALVCCSTLSLSTLPPDQIKNGSAVYSLMRNLGGALGLASINTIMFWRTAVHEQHLHESLTMARAPVRDMMHGIGGSLTLPEHALDVALLAQRVQLQSTLLSYNDALIAVTWVTCLAVPIFLLVKKARVSSAPAADH